MNKLLAAATTTASTASPSRFSLVLLEPGEIYFEDYLVYYHESRCPFDETTEAPVKGNLKICSKSVVFDPINFSYPVVKFSYKSVDRIELFNDDSSDELNDRDELYTFRPEASRNVANAKRAKCFAIDCRQIVHCKVNNKIAPYVSKKCEPGQQRHYFELIFTNVNDSLDLLAQLHRASTLKYEQEEIMLQLILKSRLSRDFKFDVHQFDDLSKEQVQFEAIVNKINPLVSNPGKIILTNMCLYYKPFNNLLEDFQTTNVFKIRLKHIKYVIKRRYHLKRVGCEIILDTSWMGAAAAATMPAGAAAQISSKHLPYLYLTFEDEATRDLFYTRLAVEQRSKLTSLEEFSQENMLQKWRYGAISNFDYLMYLNNMSDRSYNDLTQYPVFPWVLTDYSSAELDLTNPKVFRDLSKPIGALNEERLTRLRQRYVEMKVQAARFENSGNKQEPMQPTFLYGSHYSTPAFVLLYLVRQHPEWQLCLQNGRFDHPDRLFHSIEDTWRNCLTIDSDVKELLPEFFDLSMHEPSTLGSFLRNDLELDLGVRSDGARVNHVILPPWANNSPAVFIEKMRDALESPLVSENLHHWIDLIFGYKQTGPEAIKADNLFYYLCYEGAVDLDSIKDYSERKSFEIQIQEFGQIPTKLFKTPHLPKTRAIDDLDYLSVQSPQSNSVLAGFLSTTATTTSDTTPTSGLAGVPMPRKGSLPSTGFSSSPYRICASSFAQLEVKLSVKMHKSQVNDLIFLEEHVPIERVPDPSIKPELPLVCSVSTDNWIKIYSLHERSVFRSHNVANFNLSSVDCVQIWKSNSGGNSTAAANGEAGDDDEASNDELGGSSFDSAVSSGGKASSSSSQISTSSPTQQETKFTQTLLFLSCWDNSIYIYDMNYNRCIHHVADSHDDAISRLALIKIPASRSFLLVTASWDSSIKIWLTSPISPRSLKRSTTVDQQLKLQFLNELSHDSAVLNFCLTRTHLASICDDGDVILWRLNSLSDQHEHTQQQQQQQSPPPDVELDDHEFERTAQFRLAGRFERLPEQPSLETTYSFQHSIEHTPETGKITDCRVLEDGPVPSMAICTANGFVKIFNLQTNAELFSIRVYVPGSAQLAAAKLTRLVYTNDYVMTVDASGHLYFVDLQQQQQPQQANFNGGGLKGVSSSASSSSSSFLSHHIKLSSQPLTSIAVYKELMIACGDADGNLHVVSLIDI